MKVSVLAIPWFENENSFIDLRSIMVDADTLPATYDKWLAWAEDLEKGHQRAGLRVIRAVIKRREFLAFCAARNLNIDGKARIAWGNHLAIKWV